MRVDIDFVISTKPNASLWFKRGIGYFSTQLSQQIFINQLNQPTRNQGTTYHPH